MPLLLDAYNILHVVGVLPPDLAGIDLEELADLVAGSRFRGEDTLLICDGKPKRHGVNHPSVHVRFAGPGRTADETIMRLVRRSSAPRRVTVVTSDREIVQAVRRRRASVVSSDRFLAMLAEDQALGDTRQRPNPNTTMHPTDRRQVEAWLRLFDLDPEIQELAASGTETPSPPPSRAPATDRGSKPLRSKARTRGRSALEASTLSEIDPSTIDDIDTSKLLDPPEDRNDASDHDDASNPDRS